MKLNGNIIKKEPYKVKFYIPGCDFEFTAATVDFDDEALAVLQEPQAPIIQRPGKPDMRDLNDANYTKALEDYSTKRTGFFVVKSLEATEGLSWDTVDINNPETWDNYLDELKDAGFQPIEIQRIIENVLKANMVDEEYIKKAREDFLATQPQQVQAQ
jgi:hypothetical protein